MKNEAVILRSQIFLQHDHLKKKDKRMAGIIELDELLRSMTPEI